MEYNDNQIVCNQTANTINRKHSDIRALETQDLQEILSKMNYQKSQLLRENHDSKYNKIIEIFDENINSINNMISRGQQYQKKSVISALNSFAPDVYGKVPHESTLSLEQSTPQSPNVQNTRKRRFPMQGSILSSITKSFMPKRKSSVASQHHSDCEHKYYQRDCNHDWECEHHHRPDCNPKDKLVTNQIDLLRLLLLYITLRPHNPCTHRICNVCTEQFDVLMQLI